MDGITELASLFRERDKETSASITIGTVINPPPNPRIKLNDIIILEGSNLAFSSYYSSLIDKHDEVIVIPSADEQLYYVIDKVVRF